MRCSIPSTLPRAVCNCQQAPGMRGASFACHAVTVSVRVLEVPDDSVDCTPVWTVIEMPVACVATVGHSRHQPVEHFPDAHQRQHGNPTVTNPI